MNVYAVYEIHHSPGPWDRIIVGVFKTKERAQEEVDKLEAINENTVEGDCFGPYIGTSYELVEWGVRE